MTLEQACYDTAVLAFKPMRFQINWQEPWHNSTGTNINRVDTTWHLGSEKQKKMFVFKNKNRIFKELLENIIKYPLRTTSVKHYPG